MKKMIALLLGLAVISAPVMAQNDLNGPAGTAQPVQQSYYSAAVGTPGLGFNSAGSNFGQAGNFDSTSWFLGYNTVMTAIGTRVLLWNTSGQVAMNPASSPILAATAFQANVPAGNNGEYYLAYMTNGWLELHAQGAASGQVAASVPKTSTGCGTSPSVVSGTDMAGDFTVGSSPSLTCVILFASKPSNIPHCHANNSTQGVPLGVSSLSQSGFTIQSSGSSPLALNDRVDWECVGHQ